MQYSLRREIIKNVFYVILILLVASFLIYRIYDRFQEDQVINTTSSSLEVKYHESLGEKIKLTKVIPVTDSVGLSSNACTFSIKNNLTEKVIYKIKIEDDLEEKANDECSDSQIPKEDIRISIKKSNNEIEIYNLNELEDGILLEEDLKALEKVDISVRIWINQYTTLPRNIKMHYHGLVKVLEEKA